LVDIGSTTTDIVLFSAQQVQIQGFTDYQRLVSGELLYTGIIRTAVMAVAQQAYFNGEQQGLMAEYFATMADVYRVTGELTEAHDHTPTADGAPKTALASAQRLSRLTGYDFAAAEWSVWHNFAQELRRQQLTLLSAALARQRSRNLLPAQTCLVGAGVGRFLVRALAQGDYAYRDFDDLLAVATPTYFLQPADCAPAVAVAQLFSNAAAG
jgi:probable H4MPT-linked C1 transfer pathway protein